MDPHTEAADQLEAAIRRADASRRAWLAGPEVFAIYLDQQRKRAQRKADEADARLDKAIA